MLATAWPEVSFFGIAVLQLKFLHFNIDLPCLKCDTWTFTLIQIVFAISLAKNAIVKGDLTS